MAHAQPHSYAVKRKWRIQAHPTACGALTALQRTRQRDTIQIASCGQLEWSQTPCERAAPSWCCVRCLTLTSRLTKQTRGIGAWKSRSNTRIIARGLASNRNTLYSKTADLLASPRRDTQPRKDSIIVASERLMPLVGTSWRNILNYV